MNAHAFQLEDALIGTLAILVLTGLFSACANRKAQSEHRRATHAFFQSLSTFLLAGGTLTLLFAQSTPLLLAGWTVTAACMCSWRTSRAQKGEGVRTLALFLVLAALWMFYLRQGPYLVPLSLSLFLSSGAADFLFGVRKTYLHQTTQKMEHTPWSILVAGDFVGLTLLFSLLRQSDLAAPAFFGTLATVAMALCLLQAGQLLRERTLEGVRERLRIVSFTHAFALIQYSAVRFPEGSHATVLLYLAASILSLQGLGFVMARVHMRFGVLDLKSCHGICTPTPALSGIFFFLCLSCVGFPGLVTFLTWESAFAILAPQRILLGLALVSYALTSIGLYRAYLRTCLGPVRSTHIAPDLCPKERATFLMVVSLTIALGALPSLF